MEILVNTVESSDAVKTAFITDICYSIFSCIQQKLSMRDTDKVKIFFKCHSYILAENT